MSIQVCLNSFLYECVCVCARVSERCVYSKHKTAPSCHRVAFKLIFYFIDVLIRFQFFMQKNYQRRKKTYLMEHSKQTSFVLTKADENDLLSLRLSITISFFKMTKIDILVQIICKKNTLLNYICFNRIAISINSNMETFSI